MRKFKSFLAFFPMMILLSGLFACESNLREVQKITISEFSPSGDADDFVMKYTDSAKIKAILESKKMLDFATVQYPFTEFPVGILVTLFDEKAQKSYIKSDYAISFKGTDLIDLKGNVKISNDFGQYLTTEQLYFDQKNSWFYTEKPFTMVDSKSGTTSGTGIDFSKDFKVINYQNVTGAINQNN
jgi:LPS export ABC transporter protein LptC